MGAFTYPRSEPGSGGHQDLVERLHTFTSELRREVGDLPESVHSHRPGEGEWSIKEVCGHLSDHARFFHQRLFQMIKQEEPRLPAWDQMEEWKKRERWAWPRCFTTSARSAYRIPSSPVPAGSLQINGRS